MAQAAIIGMLGLQMAGTGLSASGQRAAGNAQREIGLINAQLAEEDAIAEMEDSRQNFEALLSRQKSLYAKAGVDVRSGSPLLMYVDTATKAIKDQRKVAKRGSMEADVYRRGGEAAKQAANRASWATILTGMGSGALTGYSLFKGV